MLDEKSHMVDRPTVLANPELLTEFAGTPQIEKWVASPGFSAWWIDENNTADYIMSLRDTAVRTIHDLLVDASADPKAKLKAADMILQLTDMYPGRKSEVRFLDDRINQLSETETEREIAKLKSQMAALPVGDKP